MPVSLAGKPVAVVTGGAQGIGKGIAAHLLDNGMRVVVADIDPEAGDETVAEFAEHGRSMFVETDVSSEDSVKRVFEKTLEIYGQVDALICNAGVMSPDVPVEELSLEQWNRVVTTNLTGCFLCAKFAVPHLRDTKGAIVTIGSTRALQSEANTEPYSASKGGIVALTHALAVSLGPDIRVNCISPGWIDVSQWKKSGRRNKAGLSEADHSQHPAGRVGTPVDVAELAAYLISPKAEFVTGQNFIVDGGMTRKMIYVD